MGLNLNPHSVATQKILDPYGKEFTYDFKLKLMGRKQGEAAALLISHYGIQDMTPGRLTMWIVFFASFQVQCHEVGGVK